MRRGRVLAASLLAAAFTWLSPGAARADEVALQTALARVKNDGKNDVVARTSAALSLGSSNDDRAIDPLCSTLNDSEHTVRLAAAVAMKRLNRPKSLPCLRSHEAKESDSETKVAIAKAIEHISAGEGGGGDGPIRDNPNAKYYISLSTVANATGRAQSEIERIVLKAIRTKLDGAGTVQLAPTTEAPEKAREVMKARKMKGFYLAIAVDPLDYRDGNLRVKVKIGVFNYPNKSLLGNVDKSLTAQGVSGSDKGSEDRLLDLAAGLASEQFAQNASAFL